MCGLAGFLYWRRDMGADCMVERVRRMADTLRHRGPDDRAEWVDPKAGLAFGFRRLSIVDLSPAGQQPMVSACGRYVLVFNGEIYNFQSIRALLDADGQPGGWRGHSDTEVFLAAVSRWGLHRALALAVGMFAFALWDAKEETLSLARDRLGKKPLYYGWLGGQFVFGSELKALRASPAFDAPIDRAALSHFFRLGYVPAPYSIYSGIKKVPAGSLLTVDGTDPTARPEPCSYWSLSTVVAAGRTNPFGGSDDEAVARLEQLLCEAVDERMISDVPLGASLSGGVDSSTVVALMQSRSSRPIKTFTIGFLESGYNEAEEARGIAHLLGTDHTELYVTPEEARAVIPLLPALYDEPFADSSQIPTHLVCRLARSAVTVMLSGDGGDEVFGGYNRYVWAPRVWRRLKGIPAPIRRVLGSIFACPSSSFWATLFESLERFVPRNLLPRLPAEKLQKLLGTLPARSREDLYRILVSQWPDPARVVRGDSDVPPIVASTPTFDEFADLMMFLDHVTYLPDDILVKLDRASMGVSLEARCPLLDHRVVEFAWSLPLGMKVRSGTGKFLLRQLLSKYVPVALNERPKMGFGVPIDSWLRGPLRDWAGDLLEKERLRREGFLDAEMLQRVWGEHLDGRRNHAHALWCALMFESWLAATH